VLSGHWTLLSTYLRPQRRRVALLAVLLLGNIGLELAAPQILRYFIDTARSGGAEQRLFEAAALFIGVALVTQLLAVSEIHVAENVAWTATNALRGDLMLHLLRLDLGFHHNRTPGELIERVDGDVTTLANFFARFAIALVGNVLLLAGVLVLLLGVDRRVGLALTVFVVLALAAMLRLRSIAVPYFAAARQTSAEFFGFLGEMLTGTEDLRAAGATSYVMRRLAEYMQGWLRIQRKAGVVGYTGWMISIALFALGTAVAFGLGAYLYQGGAITIGTTYLVFGYTQLLARPTEGLRTQVQDLQQAGASIGRIQDLLHTAPKVDDGLAGQLPPGSLSLEFAGVSFAYGAEPVLSEVTFSLQPGCILGLVGRTGSGKSTLTRLITRLYDPTAGTVRVGGVDTQTVKPVELRRRVGVVTQDVQLFEASIRDNLTFFDDGVTDARLAQVLRDVGLGDWYLSQPAGLDTELARGGNLSAGEAQLLALARIFLNDPDLVILDEASSRLDPATERQLQRATEKLLRGRTAIVVAHRLSTLDHADEVVVLEGGRVLEQGRHAELAANPGSHFHRLLRTGLEAIVSWAPGATSGA